LRLEGKVAIVTGASRGLGEYTALKLAAEGAAVVIAARTEQVQDQRLPGTIHDTARRINEAGGRSLAIRCNVSDPAECQAMARAARDAFGRIDILVNNAAVQAPGGMGTVRPRHWELEFRVNVHGVFYATRSVIPTMEEQGSGVIINISSVAADGVASGRGGHYGVTKVTVEAMTRAFASELAPSGIAVVALKPRGAVDTPGLRFAWTAGGAQLPADIPGPEDYVEAAAILCTATPSTLTGVALADHEVIARYGRGGVIA